MNSKIDKNLTQWTKNSTPILKSSFFIDLNEENS